jgi:hypothetical protein
MNNNIALVRLSQVWRHEKGFVVCVRSIESSDIDMRLEDDNAAPKFGPQAVPRKFRIEATCRRP